MNKYTLVLLGIFSISAAQGQNLNDVFELALQQDPYYLKAKAELDAIGEKRPQAIAQLLPNLSLSGRSSRQRIHNKKAFGFQGGGTQNFWDHGISLDLTQPLFHWNHWVQLSQSDNHIARLQALYAAAEQDLLIRTTQAYLNILLAKDTLQFSRAEKQALSRQLEQAQQRFDVGLIAKTDVLEAQAGFDLARANEISADVSADNSIEALWEIIGVQPENLAILGDKLPLQSPDPVDIEAWVKAADLQNLTIIAEINQTELSRKEVERMRSGHYPTVDIVGSLAYQDSNSSFALRGDTRGIGVQMQIPIFEGGAVNSRIRQAEFTYLAAQKNLEAVRRKVKRQVKDAYRAVVANIGQVNAFAAAVASSQSALESAEAGMEVGTRTMVDVVEQQKNLFRAKRDHARTRYDFINSWLVLKQAASSLTGEDLEKVNQLLTPVFK